MGELVDRALHSGVDRVAGLPLERLLLGADAELQAARDEVEMPSGDPQASRHPAKLNDLFNK
ncbi:hypothetical protein ACFWFF_25065 [Streptomyces sp. NPDC060223]|uniref:hypothetical protein n=1 Tax=unclassified Streptomyces TaxID=2593676 RepID=UPI0036398A56